jgi:hypothetical protein
MADPATILNDPDFVSANAATKQAIFAKHVANDPDFKNANPDTQQAIKARFGFEVAPPATSSGIPGARQSPIDQIPGVNPNMAQPAPTKPLTLREKISGAIETPFAVGANLLSAPITYLAGAGGPEFQRAVSKEITYQPRTQLAQEAVQAVGQAAEASKIPPYMTPMGFATSLGPATQAVADVAQAGKAVATAPLAARNARIAQERSLQSYQNAPRIDAAKDALDLGVALNPATANPTAANKLRTAIVGSDTLDTKLAQHNQGKFTEAAKADLGLAPTDTLNSKAFETSRARPEVSAPYDAVRNMKSLDPTADTMTQLESMRVQPLVGDTGQAAAANVLLDAVKEQLAQGVDGKTLVDSIRARRREAQAIYNQQSKGITPPAPEAIAKADMNMGVANALESMIESNIDDPKLLGAFRNARTALAKTYDYERATNFATGQLDPQVIAKMAAEGKPLTGTLAKIGNVAANYPEVSKGGVLNQPTWRETLPRSGAAGTIGGIIGSSFGLPGAIAGGATGAAIGNVASGALARSMTKPGFQAAKAMPPDFRQPIVNNLQPGTSNLAIFDPVNALVNPASPVNKPNWVYAQPQPEVKTGVQPMPPQLEAPSGASTMRTVAEQRQFDYNMQKALEEKAAQEQAAREAAGRQVTKGGVVIGEQPAQGQGLPQPASLSEASRKVAAGQMFDMTAPEKVMWDRTRVSLEQAAPELSKLTDKQIANKAMDRQWIAETYAKAKEKAAAFDEIAKRATDAQAKFEASARRDQMLDLLSTLEDNLRQPRPTSAGGQGPKTREAIRNQLVGGANKNNLAP